MRLRFLSLACLLVSALFVSGCGKGKTVKVSGVVTLDGQAVDGAMVKFVPLDEAKGMGAFGRTGSDGTFRLTTRNPNDGALPGEYKVLVTFEQQRDAPTSVGGGGPGEGMQGKGQMTDMMRGMANQDRKAASQPKTKKTSTIPTMYGDAKQTPFQKVVVPTDGEVKLELRSKGG